MLNKPENILIVGLGGIGYYLAKRLARDGHAITVIESNRARLHRADGEVDARLIRGDAMSFATWKDAAADTMDYSIAVTDNDAVNIMSTRIAHRLGIRRKIARVRATELWDEKAILTPEDLAIDLVIRPEELTALEIARLLKMRAGNVIIDIADGQMQVMATRIQEASALAHAKIKDLSKVHDDFHFRIAVVSREANTIIPGGDLELLPGDYVFILARSDDLRLLMLLSGVSQTKRHRVMIIGGGLIGSRIAELLESSFPVRLIEQDERRAEELSYKLQRTELLHGDGSDTETLLQAGILDMDTVITATGDNETNIMSSVLARHLIRHKTKRPPSAGKTIALVKREEYLTLAASMGADVVINKKVMAASAILQDIRRGRLLSVAHLHGVDAEVVELVAERGAPITRSPLYAVPGMTGKIIIGGVGRNGEWEIALGSTEIEPGDRVVGVCLSEALSDLQNLLLA